MVASECRYVFYLLIFTADMTWRTKFSNNCLTEYHVVKTLTSICDKLWCQLKLHQTSYLDSFWSSMKIRVQTWSDPCKKLTCEYRKERERGSTSQSRNWEVGSSDQTFGGRISGPLENSFAARRGGTQKVWTCKKKMGSHFNSSLDWETSSPPLPPPDLAEAN